ncbi:MAG TPA: ATP-binding protein, partial [Acetobacteraceae bacterium]
MKKQTVSPDFLAGGGELGALMRATDWSRTQLGPAESWPRSLTTLVRVILTSRQPMFVWWGEQLINLYNDPYRAILGGKHPQALGQPASVVWREIWDQVGPRAAQALSGNEGTYDEALLLIMERYGYPEETYYTFSYSPVPGDDGGIGGILCANTDDTQRIIGERQVALLRDLAARTAEARTAAEACRLAAAALQTASRDLPFALLYLTDAEHRNPRFAASAGLSASWDTERLCDVSIWPMEPVLRTGAAEFISDLGTRLEPLPRGAWDRPPSSAIVLPIAAQGQSGCAGLLVVGLNPYRSYEDSYRGFLGLVAGTIAAALANAQAYEQERRRAEALAEIDRAKTAFFSNASHEFRTPLTLMLGPLENLLVQSATRDTVLAERTELELMHRNGLRLLKLVNTLLDFSRIEAGRIQAIYDPVDLAAFTAELASGFRSAMDRAGLRFTVDCPPLPAEAYVDRDMWEKIVLNLLSNAFKYTLDGSIAVRLRAVEDGTIALTVEDTGVGIPDSELPRVFERFHRIEGQRGRTHEGTGIGLALVQELARLHSGTVDAESTVGQGTRFRVTIPSGREHLPPERIQAARQQLSTGMRANAFVEEAMRWLAGAADEPDIQRELLEPDLTAVPGSERSRVLLADDNADMRHYVQRLLAPRYAVEAVADGRAALEAVRRHPPDLVLTDVMMPRLDGFGLLRMLRADPDLRDIPVVLLSARAGEEARVEGLEAG